MPMTFHVVTLSGTVNLIFTSPLPSDMMRGSKKAVSEKSARVLVPSACAAVSPLPASSASLSAVFILAICVASILSSAT